MIDIQFGTLFSFELLHRYFSNRLCNDFSIVPSQKTVVAMSGYRVVAKQYGNVLYAGIQTTKKLVAGIVKLQPFINPAPDAQYTFFLQLNHDLFFNYTNLPSTYTRGKIYYFTNRNANAANGKNFLSQPVTYNNSQNYIPGDMAADSSGMVYECILSVTGKTPSAANSQYWMAIDKNQYFSEADVLQWMPSISSFPFTGPQSSVSVMVLGYDPAAGTYTRAVYSLNISFQTPALSFTLDLSVLSPGKYKLTVNAISQWIYLNDELNSSKAFAVVDLFNDSSLATGYQLLDGSGYLLSPLYTMYFLNRYSIWKYVIASGNTGLITDTASVFSFTTPAASTIYSKTPLPLSEQALALTITIGTATPVGPIACPSFERLVTYQPNPPAGDVFNCSEIYLNY